MIIYIGEPTTQPRIATARTAGWLEADIDQTYLNESEQAELCRSMSLIIP